jgi:murein DD-endopeptidase MepM/ murein hydrolase activator NlpD
MARMDPAAFQAIADFFGPAGVPIQIPLIMGYMESGLDPGNYNNAADGYRSFGLYQAHIDGGMGTGHDPANLVDPFYHVNLIGPAIVDAFQQAGGTAAWQQAVQSGPGAAQEFIKRVHKASLNPADWALNQNYAAHWDEALGSIAQTYDSQLRQYAGGGQQPPSHPLNLDEVTQFYQNLGEPTSGFGNPFPLDGPYTDPDTGQYYPHFNKGYDFAAAPGTAIPSTVSGTVVFASNDGAGWGTRVVVQDANGYRHSWGHVDPNTLVQVGQKIQRGQPVAVVGSGGQPGEVSTGAHISYDVSTETPNGVKYVDPMQFLKGAFDYGSAALGAFGLNVDLGDMAAEYLASMEEQANPLDEGDYATAAAFAQEDYAQFLKTDPADHMTQGLDPAHPDTALCSIESTDPRCLAIPRVEVPMTQAQWQDRADTLKFRAEELGELMDLEETYGGIEVGLQNGQMSITMNPATYAKLTEEEKAFVDQALANNGTELYNGFAETFNRFKMDEYNIAEQYATFQNDITGKLHDWAVENQLNINSVEQLNYELKRQHGMDLNDVVQQNWENEFRWWEGEAGMQQQGFENEMSSAQMANDLILTLHELARAYTDDERNKIESEYNSKLQHYDNLLKYDDASREDVTARLERWFGIREQNQDRTEFLASQAPWMTTGNKTSFSPADLGGAAAQIAGFAGMDPNANAFNYTGTFDPAGYLSSLDKQQGVGGQAPDYAAPIATPGAIPDPYTLPGSVKPPGADAFQGPPDVPVFPGAPNPNELTVGWGEAPTLNWGIQAPTSLNVGPDLSQYGFLNPRRPDISNPMATGGSIGNIPGLAGIMDLLKPYLHSGGVARFGAMPAWHNQLDPQTHAMVMGAQPGERLNDLKKKHRMVDPNNPASRFAPILSGGY